MNIETIIEIFGRLAGLEAEEATDFRFMCESSVGYITSRLKSGVDISHRCSRLEFAAAALAFYRFILWRLTDGGSNEVKVGDISVKESAANQIDAAEQLCKEAFSAINDILEPTDFVFRGI